MAQRPTPHLFTLGSRYTARQPTVSQAASQQPQAVAARAAAKAGLGLDEQWTIDFTVGSGSLDSGFRGNDRRQTPLLHMAERGPGVRHG